MFRFTIRDMLWLTVVVALAVGWWLQRKTAVVALEKAQEAKEMENAMLFTVSWNADELRKSQQEVELLTAKLRKTGYRWHFMLGRRLDGSEYVFMVDD